MHNPGIKHMQHAQHILRYLANTLNVGVTYNGMRSAGDTRATTLWGYSGAITIDQAGKELTTYEKMTEVKATGLLKVSKHATDHDSTNNVPVVCAIHQHRKSQKSNASDTFEAQPTKDKNAAYVRNMRKVFNQQHTHLVGISDASLADNPDTRRSSCGHGWFLNGGFITAKATQQSVVALSSCESEYIASCMAIKIGAYLRGLLFELGFPQRTSNLYTDNSANIDLSLHSRISPRTAHIDTRYHFVKEQVQAKSVELKYISTEQMPADALTKSLDKTRHIRHACILQNQRIQLLTSSGFVNSPT